MLNHSSKRLAGAPNICTDSSQPHTSLTKHYDGLGGRARLDQFPQQRRDFSSSQLGTVGRGKQIKTGKSKVGTIVTKQSKTIDKFFGSFDTP